MLRISEKRQLENELASTTLAMLLTDSDDLHSTLALAHHDTSRLSEGRLPIEGAIADRGSEVDLRMHRSSRGGGLERADSSNRPIVWSAALNRIELPKAKAFFVQSLYQTLARAASQSRPPDCSCMSVFSSLTDMLIMTSLAYLANARLFLHLDEFFSLRSWAV